MTFNKETKTITVVVVGTNPILQSFTAAFQQTHAFVYFVLANAITSLYNLLAMLLLPCLKNIGRQSPCKSSGAESLPKGIISRISDMEMVPLWGAPEGKEDISSQKSLLAMAVGIKQKQTVDQIVMKFALSNYTIMLFHYDGIVDKWKDLQWSDSVLHISAINQTKWWFAKRFLHPDIVAPYKYIFLWDEDLGVENFHPESYLTIVEKEGLEISQPALDPTKSSR
ncbi:uncharacterized protein LOC122036031, partial [Zingiber officinale]|uniref:uncharacterized protein LOC122036031 n=1 Tax=Zingiber officinale TaxID=94328 RepID=UPI001C4D2849